MPHLRTVFAVGNTGEMSTQTAGRPTLRERRRQDLTEEIKEVARRHLRTEGLASLSLRAVAREVGMAVSAVYRYFGSRDDLITALLVDAYEAQAEFVEAAHAAAGEDPAAQMRASLLAFREWSVAHAAEYGLMYGNPLPGYEAPPDRLVEPGTRVARLLYRTIGEADATGRLDPEVTGARVAALPAEHLEQLDVWRASRVPDLSLAVVVVTIDLWTRVQGLLSLEIFGQLRPVLPDPAAYHAATVDAVIADIGLAP